MIDLFPELKGLSGDKRESLIYRVLTNPYNHSLRMNVTKVVASTKTDANGKTRLVEIDTTPDYLGVDTPEGYLRLPMFPGTARKIVRELGWELPTKKIVNDIFFGADVKVDPSPLSTGFLINNLMSRPSSKAYREHSRRINNQILQVPADALIAGGKKDIVYCHALTTKLFKGKVAIYGWHKPSGQVVQDLNYKSHHDRYVDYSHGVRPIKAIRIDGVGMNLRDLLMDPVLHVLVSTDPTYDNSQVYA